MSITVDPDSKQYDLAEIRLDSEVIVAEEFSVTIETSSDPKTATNSRDPVGYKGGTNEYSFDASGVSLEFLSLLQEYQVKRTSFPVGVFSFDDDGNYEELLTLLHCRITSVEPSADDEGMTLDIEGSALSVKSN